MTDGYFTWCKIGGKKTHINYKWNLDHLWSFQLRRRSLNSHGRNLQCQLGFFFSFFFGFRTKDFSSFSVTRQATLILLKDAGESKIIISQLMKETKLFYGHVMALDVKCPVKWSLWHKQNIALLQKNISVWSGYASYHPIIDSLLVVF